MTAKQRCGRKETIVWPPHAPIYTFSALAVGVLVTVFFVWQHLRFSETALQQTYTTTYIGSLTVTLFKQHGNYRLLYVGGGKAASRLALPADFLPGTTILPSGKTVPVTLPTSRSTRATLFSSRDLPRITTMLRSADGCGTRSLSTKACWSCTAFRLLRACSFFS